MTPQVDWMKVVVPCWHRQHVHGGVRARFEDSTDWTLDYKILEAAKMEGSASSMVRVRTRDAWDFFEARDGETFDDLVVRHAPFLPEDYVTALLSKQGLDFWRGSYFLLEVEGNITKYFQGHSLYGTDNYGGLLVDFLVRVVKAFGISPLAEDVRKWRHGIVYPMRLDLCRNYRLDNYKTVDRFIAGVVRSCTLNNRGFRFDHAEKKEGFTAVHNTAGRIYRLSIYNKYCDLRDHRAARPAFEDEDLNRALIEHANGLARIECKFKSEFFRRKGIMTLLDLWKHYPDLSAMLDEVVDKIQTGGANLDDEKMNRIKQKAANWALPVLLMWLDGYNPHEIKLTLGGGKRTDAGDRKYRRAVKYFRDEFGLNLKVLQIEARERREERAKVVPLVEVLRAKPEGPPQWMYDKGLIYEPSEHLLHRVK